MARWKYGLVAVALTSWFAKLALEFISNAADWFWYICFACWFLMSALAVVALVRRRWRELAVFATALFVTFFPALNFGVNYTDRLQDEAFRIYALLRIKSLSINDALSGCEYTDFSSGDTAKQRIVQCHFRRNSYFTGYSVIYDPTGQAGLPARQRIVDWIVAVERVYSGLTSGYFIAHTDELKHLVGDFYYVKLGLEEWSDSDPARV